MSHAPDDHYGHDDAATRDWLESVLKGGPAKDRAQRMATALSWAFRQGERARLNALSLDLEAQLNELGDDEG